MSPAPRALWAYTYRLVRPQSAERMRALNALLDQARLDARHGKRTWGGRLVSDERVTRILIVSDSPRVDQAGNHRLEQALREIDADFDLTLPLALGHGAALVVPAPFPPLAASPARRLPRKQ